jgi:cation diffusion facilitator CzcD-associated flavoprotein CzcO
LFVSSGIHTTSSYDAVIVGAGWSGIKAAETLLKGGVNNILVLEAHDYIGGR